MGGIGRRIEALERAYGTEPEEDSEAMARCREELKARWPSALEKAAREEAEGNPARRIALEELKERILARRPSL
jgi:hypothetical protein